MKRTSTLPSMPRPGMITHQHHSGATLLADTVFIIHATLLMLKQIGAMNISTKTISISSHHFFKTEL